MTKCFFCNNLVNDNNTKKIHFCSNYCLEQVEVYQKNINDKFTITNKICNRCFGDINYSNPVFYCNDKIYCSEKCRNIAFYKLLYS